jgi:serine/threonine-protein kinase
MYWTRADGAGKPQPLLLSKEARYFPSSFTPSGTQQLAFSEQIIAGGSGIRILPVESVSGQLRAGEPRLFLKTAAALAFPSFSPDGRWLAYADAEGGNYEVYVRAFPDNGTRVQISTAGGSFPIWSPNGHELFYRTESQRIMVTNYGVKGGSFIPEKPRVWSGKRLANVGLNRNLDIALDGKRFVAVMPLDSPEPRENQSHVMLELNFFDEVRRRVPGQAK